MSLWGSQYASHVEELLNGLDDDKLKATGSTACNGRYEGANREENVVIILRYTKDLDRLFSYQKITGQFLRDYLYKKGLPINQEEHKQQLVERVKQEWGKSRVQQEGSTMNLWGSQYPSNIGELVRGLQNNNLRTLANTAYTNRFMVDDSKKRCRSTNDKKRIMKTTSGASPWKKGKKWAQEGRPSFAQPAEQHRRSFPNATTTLKEFDDDVEVIEQPFQDNTGSRQHKEQSSEAPSPSPIPLPPPGSCQRSSTPTQEPTNNNTSTRTNHREKAVAHTEKRTADRDEIMNILSAEQNLDDVDLFFQSIAKSVKKLSPQLQHRAKVRTLDMVGRLEEELVDVFHSLPFSYHPSSAPASESPSGNGSSESNAQSPPYSLAGMFSPQQWQSTQGNDIADVQDK